MFFFKIGISVFEQIIGIPLGSDLAPFFVNLVLASYEIKWIKNKKKDNYSIARKFNHVFRYIDDLLAINDNMLFQNFYKEIYPQELELKKENANNLEAHFLDLNIKIENNTFITRLYDKRNDYPFKVVRLSYYISNIRKHMF